MMTQQVSMLNAALGSTRLGLALGCEERLTWYDDRHETVATHTFTLTMLVIELLERGADKGGPGWSPVVSEQAVKYALAHDLVEAVVGDTPTLIPLTPVKAKKKAEAEKKALPVVQSISPYWGDEAREYEEGLDVLDSTARFVYWVDKLMPLLVFGIDPRGSLRATEPMTGEDHRRLGENRLGCVIEDCEFPALAKLFGEAEAYRETRRRSVEAAAALGSTLL